MWSKRILGEVLEAHALPGAIADLLAQQRETWPALREGEAALAAMPTRVLGSGNAGLVAQANLRRRVSTFARTDTRSIAERPCFLCETNLPPEERGVEFADLVVMANPFPAVPEHLTLASKEHVEQRLVGRIGTMLEAAQGLGAEFFVLYNGPHCGASAPDHFHFQAGRRALMPIFEHSGLDLGTGTSVLAAGARVALRVRAATLGAAQEMVEAALSKLVGLDAAPPEPKVNVLVTHRQDHFVILIFPRTRHRPANFFEPGQALAISPASLEMAGLLVVCDEDEFKSVTVQDVEHIFEQVCVSESQLRDAVEIE